MRAITILVAALAVSSFVAGCGDKSDPAPTTTSPGGGNATTTPPTGTTPTPTPTNSSTPMPDEQLKAGTITYAPSGNGAAQTLEVKTGTTKLVFTVSLNITAGGPYSITGPPPPATGKAFAELKSGTTQVAKIEFTDKQGVLTTAREAVYVAASTEVLAPAAGPFSVAVVGTGQNVQAEYSVVASYA